MELDLVARDRVLSSVHSLGKRRENGQRTRRIDLNA